MPVASKQQQQQRIRGQIGVTALKPAHIRASNMMAGGILLCKMSHQS